MQEPFIRTLALQELRSFAAGSSETLCVFARIPDTGLRWRGRRID